MVGGPSQSPWGREQASGQQPQCEDERRGTVRAEEVLRRGTEWPGSSEVVGERNEERLTPCSLNRSYYRDSRRECYGRQERKGNADAGRSSKAEAGEQPKVLHRRTKSGRR